LLLLTLLGRLRHPEPLNVVPLPEAYYMLRDCLVISTGMLWLLVTEQLYVLGSDL
jgi:hypothetical protein